MKNKTIPCKDCLVLALCRNKAVIECSLLYNYLLLSSKPDSKRYDISRKQLGDAYRFTKPGRVIAARKIYNEKGECMWL